MSFDSEDSLQIVGVFRIVLKFNSALRSAETFYTDSNGREMIKRVRDRRGPSYPPFNSTGNEPVAANYYRASDAQCRCRNSP